MTYNDAGGLLLIFILYAQKQGRMLITEQAESSVSFLGGTGPSK